MRSLLFILIVAPLISFSQGENAVWLMGNQPNSNAKKGIMLFDSLNYTYQIQYRQMAFEGTEATISDRNGNFLMRMLPMIQCSMEVA
jgi:hypothetical protein